MSDALDSNLANCLNETHRVGVDHSIKSIETQLQNWAAIYMNFSDIESHHWVQEIQGVNKSDISNLSIIKIELSRINLIKLPIVKKMTLMNS